MVPQSPASGQSLTGFVIMALVAGVLIFLAANPAVREGFAKLTQNLRSNPVRTYLYGHEPQEEHGTGTPPDGPSSSEPTASEAEDTFDYSIFMSQPPRSTD